MGLSVSCNRLCFLLFVKGFIDFLQLFVAFWIYLKDLFICLLGTCHLAVVCFMIFFLQLSYVETFWNCYERIDRLWWWHSSLAIADYVPMLVSRNLGLGWLSLNADYLGLSWLGKSERLFVYCMKGPMWAWHVTSQAFFLAVTQWRFVTTSYLRSRDLTPSSLVCHLYTHGKSSSSHIQAYKCQWG